MLELVLKGEIIPVYSQEILQEYQDVLEREKFGFSKNIIKSLILYIAQKGISVNPVLTYEELIDRKDLPFYEVVTATRNESVLVTGNLKHFPERDYIITPRQLINALENQKFQ